MPHSLGQVYVHLVLSTKNRFPWLVERALRERSFGYMAGIFRNLRCPALWIGGVEDHVHVLFRLSRVQPIVRVVGKVRIASSGWLRIRGLTDFDWQDDYGAFSVSPQNVDGVVRYLKNQEELHREVTFAEEYDGILQRSEGLQHRVEVHLVYSTKNRIPFLTDKGLRQLLHDRLETLCEGVSGPCLGVGGIEDHVHLLFRLSREQQVAEVVQEIKRCSTSWLAARHDLADFDWQDGYGAFSVSPQHVPSVLRYIANQEEHHRVRTFADEIRNPFTWD